MKHEVGRIGEAMETICLKDEIAYVKSINEIVRLVQQECDVPPERGISKRSDYPTEVGTRTQHPQRALVHASRGAQNKFV